MLYRTAEEWCLWCVFSRIARFALSRARTTDGETRPKYGCGGVLNLINVYNTVWWFQCGRSTNAMWLLFVLIDIFCFFFFLVFRSYKIIYVHYRNPRFAIYTLRFYFLTNNRNCIKLTKNNEINRFQWRSYWGEGQRDKRFMLKQ